MEQRQIDEVKENLGRMKENETRPFQLAQGSGGPRLYVAPREGEPALPTGEEGCAGQVTRIDGVLIFRLEIDRGVGKPGLQQGLRALQEEVLGNPNWMVQVPDADA